MVGYRIDRSKATCLGAEGPTKGHKILLAVQVVSMSLKCDPLTQDFHRDVVDKRDIRVDELRQIFG